MENGAPLRWRRNHFTTETSLCQ